MFGRKKREQQAEAAPLRAFLREKIVDYKKTVAFEAPMSKSIQEMALEDARHGTASSADIERRLDNAFGREVEARGLLAAAYALEAVIASHPTKSEIISNIERLASEFARDATRSATKAKTAWREHKRLELARDAFVQDRTARCLNGLLSELFPSAR